MLEEQMRAHQTWSKDRIQFVEEVRTKLIPNVFVGMSLMKECE